MAPSRRALRRLQHRRRRFLALALGLIAVVATLGPTTCGPAPPTRTDDPCALLAERPRWYRFTRQAAERWAVEDALLLAVVEQESRFEARARPPREQLFGFIPWRRRSSAFGYAQALDGTWAQYEAQIGSASRHRYEDAIDFVGWYLASLRDQLDLDADDARALYLAYHEGPSGYRRGSYRHKPWLLDVADRLSRRVVRYRGELEQCRGAIERRIWLRRLGAVTTLAVALGLIWLVIRRR